jgi:CHAT domain
MRKLLAPAIVALIYIFGCPPSICSQNNEEILKTLKQEVETASAVIDTKPPNEKEIDKAVEQLEIIRKKTQITPTTEFKKLEALILRTVAAGYSAKFSLPKALEYYLLELPLEKELGEKTDEGKCLSAIGFVYNQIGDRQKASDTFNIDVRGKNTVFGELKNVLSEIRSVVREENEKTGIYTGKRLENTEFTQDSFNKNLYEKYQLVHIASHFYYDAGSPLESFLLLGDGSKLELADLRKRTNTFEGTELLTLSACETARGGINSFGKEIEGLAVLAQKQGAKSVLATLWQVEDTSTRKIMSDFYENLSKLKMSKAEALRQAQLKMLLPKNASSLQKHPFYWASFTLVGDWR